MDNSYTVLAAMCPITVLSAVVPSMYYINLCTLYNKSTENMSTRILDGIPTLYVVYVSHLDNRYKGQYVLFST